MNKNIVIIGLILLSVILGILLFDSNSRIKNLRKTVDSREVETPAPKITENPDSLTSVEKLKAKVAKLEEEKSSLEEENSKLEKEKKELKSENLELTSSKKDSSSSDLTYLEIKFWYDGNNYEVSDTNLKIYKNVSLTKKVKERVIVVSPTISEDHLDNGLTVYTVMSLNGPVFMSSYPSLSVIEGSHLKAPASAFSQKATDKYLAIKFWEGEYYKKLYEGSNQTWYTDCSLQNSIDNSESIIISSENNDCFVMSNGIQVYTSQADDGSILWMHDSPNFETIE